MGLQTGTTTVEISMKVPEKTKNWSTVWSSNTSTGYLPQRPKEPYPKRYLYTDVHSCIIHSGQDMEATKMSYDRWLAKEAVEYYLAIRRDKILPFATM